MGNLAKVLSNEEIRTATGLGSLELHLTIKPRRGVREKNLIGRHAFSILIA
jgi:hypothetical protein